MEDDKYIEVSEEINKPRKLSVWKKVLIAFSGVVVAFMIIILYYVMNGGSLEMYESRSQTVTENEEDSVPIQKVECVIEDAAGEKKAILEQQWETLGERQQFLAFGTHLYRNEEEEYKYSKEFVDVFYMIADGWFSGASVEDLEFILPLALEELPNTASGKEVYDKLISIVQTYKQEVMVMKKGESPYELIARQNSPYASDRCGYKIGDVVIFSDKVTATYQGKDIWIDTDGVTWRARAWGEDGIEIGLPEWF